MPVPTLITELSQTPATNSPPGSESPSSIDDYLRAHASFTALLRDSKADLASPTLTGTPSSTTPARFDRSTRIATMAAIGAEQGSLAGQLAINVSQAIAASNGGSEINASGTITLTLPVGAAVPAGAAFIVNNSGVGVVTIVPTGSDVLKRIDAAAGSIVLGAGDATTIVFAGGTLFNARVFLAQRFGRNNILGTVSQAAGVPTGAVIERGSNANGEFVRFADGTQICTNFVTQAVIAGPAVTTVQFVYAAAFIGKPIVTATAGAPNVSEDTFGFVRTYLNETNLSTFGFRNGASAQTIANNMFSAIGRWF